MKGYEGIYVISKEGDVYNMKQRKIQTFMSNSGYKMIKLSNNKDRKGFYIHRLVANHYLDNPLSLREVNHIDGNKINNNLLNLEYISPSDNIKHAYKIGKRVAQKGYDNILSKTVRQLTKSGEEIGIFGSTVEACRETGIHFQSIGACCRKAKHYKSAGGFIWEYI